MSCRPPPDQQASEATPDETVEGTLQFLVDVACHDIEPPSVK